jgi:epoxyqueuosine reductase QueG
MEAFLNGEVRSSIENAVRGSGAALFGVADLRGVDLEQISAAAGEVSLSGLSTGISFGYRLSDVVLDGLVDYPTRTYQYHYRQVNLLLDHIALRVASQIAGLGARVFPVPASQILDWNTYRGHISHKAVARLAGLGWIGRNNLLVNAVHGSRVRYCTVLTDLDLPCDRPLEADCGPCTRCVAACPGGAIVEDPAGFNLARCVETIDRVRQTENIGSRVCGLCVKACAGQRP